MLYEGIDVDTNQRAKPKTVPAPIGGLNLRDALADMDAKDAYQMDNMWPGTTSCRVRAGCEVYRDVGAPCYSLDSFSGGGIDADQLMALNGDGEWYNVTEDPIVLKHSGIDGIETVSTMFSTVADSAQHLIVTTEGADLPWSYDGTVITELAFTGLAEAAENINYVCSYMARLFWGTKDRLGFYYLPVGQIQGVMEWYDLGQLSKLGGHLEAIATCSDDSGDGPHDYIVFLSSKGEYFMFRGIDPGDPENWEIVGRYRSAPPVKRKCVIDYAGDLVILTLEGALQFSEIRKLADTRFEITALTSKLGDTLQNHNVYRRVHGWDMILYPRAGWLLINVPHSNSVTGLYHQFVMNTTTQSWMRIESKEWDGLCWAVANDNLYFGRYDGSVRQADTGTFDNGKAIKYTVKQAYNYFGSMSFKHFKWSIFLMESDAPIMLAANINVDFKPNKPVPVSGSLDDISGAKWDEAFWDDEFWATGPYTQRMIQSYGQYGVTSSNWIIGQVSGATLEWFATQSVFEEAEGLLG